MTTKKSRSHTVVHKEMIHSKIFFIRGKRVMLDKDLSLLYGVKPIALRQQVKRNLKRFPKDFMFQLNEKEVALMVSHFVIPSKKQLGGHRPYVFTEQGVAMLSSVLNSEQSIEVNIQIMRAFTKLREMMATHLELKQKIDQMEKKYDYPFKVVFEAIKQLLDSPKKSNKSIGFY